MFGTQTRSSHSESVRFSGIGGTVRNDPFAGHKRFRGPSGIVAPIDLGNTIKNVGNYETRAKAGTALLADMLVIIIGRAVHICNRQDFIGVQNFG